MLSHLRKTEVLDGLREEGYLVLYAYVMNCDKLTPTISSLCSCTNKAREQNIH